MNKPTTCPTARAMAIASLNDLIAEIDENARIVLECSTIGMSCDPATMEDIDRDVYERLITLAKRARCAMTLLGLDTVPQPHADFVDDAEGRN